LHNLTGGYVVVLGFDGTHDEVEWQLGVAKELGFTEPATLDYDGQFRSEETVAKISVLPSKLGETLATLGDAKFVARAGNGVIYFRGRQPAAKGEVPAKLTERLKKEFDPKSILPALPL
jgi:hypothetical protein